MLDYLEDKFGERATMGDKHNLTFMRDEAKRLEQLVAEQKEREMTKGDTKDDEEVERNSESDTDQDVSQMYSF